MTCSKFLNIAAARGIYQSRECERILVRKIFQMQIWNMFSTHFKEKATLLKFMHRILVCSQKVVFLIICFRNLTDACIGYIFLTDAFASIASA